MTQIYDKSLTKAPIKCMKLIVFPEDINITETMRGLYDFDDKCPLKLEISYREGIHCNSNQNADRKALSNFPQSYLRMELRKGLRLQYSYYTDLSDAVDTVALENAFKRIKKDLDIK
ncbi:MAG TPA: hypothetical protein EYG98_07160 [Sulfurovum sp.]|nr:hypothetical protein [Sulfurovum sp.]